MNDAYKEEVLSAQVRSQAYRLLASIFFRELDEDQISFLKNTELPVGENARMEEGAARIYKYFRMAPPDVLTRLRVDYARIFLAAGVFEGDTAVPFESVFTGEESLMMQEARDDVILWYAKEDVSVDSDLRTPEDHISFEFEFLAITCERMAKALEEDNIEEVKRLVDVQARFAREHILNWIDLLKERVDKFAKEAFYPAFMDYAAGFVEDDVEYLDQLDFE